MLFRYLIISLASVLVIFPLIASATVVDDEKHIKGLNRHYNIQKVPFRFPFGIERDSYGRLWFGGFEGLFYLNAGKIEPFDTVLAGREAYITDIEYDSVGKRLFVASENGVSFVNTETLETGFVPIDSERLRSEITKTLYYVDNKLYLFMDGLNVVEYDLVTETLEEFEDLAVDSQYLRSLNFRDQEFKSVSGDGLESIYALLWSGDVLKIDTLSKKAEVIVKTTKPLQNMRMEKLNLDFYFLSLDPGDGYKGRMKILANDIVEDLSPLNDYIESRGLTITNYDLDSEEQKLYLGTRSVIQGNEDTYLLSYDLVHNKVEQIAKDENYITAVYAEKGLVYSVNANYELLVGNKNNLVSQVYSTSLTAFTESAVIGDSVFVGTNSGVVAIGEDGKVGIVDGTEGLYVKSLVAGTADTFYFATGSSLFSYALNDGKMKKLRDDFSYRMHSLVYYKRLNRLYYIYNRNIHYLDLNTLQEKELESNKSLESKRYDFTLRLIGDVLYIGRLGSGIVLQNLKRHSIDTRTVSAKEIKKRRIDVASGAVKREDLQPIFPLAERRYSSMKSTSSEIWILYGNSIATRIDAKNYDNSLEYYFKDKMVRCINKYKDRYLVVADNKVYDWDGKDSKNISLIADLGVYQPSSVTLGKEICDVANDLLVVGSGSGLLYFNVEKFGQGKHQNQVSLSKAKLYDSDMRLLSSRELKAFSEIKVNAPGAAYMGLSFIDDNEYTDAHISLTYDGRNYEGESVVIPLSLGDNNIVWNSRFGTLLGVNKEILISYEYNLYDFLAYYFSYISAIVVLSFLIYILYKKYLKSYVYVKNEKQFVLSAISSSLLRIKENMNIIKSSNSLFLKESRGGKNAYAIDGCASEVLNIIKFLSAFEQLSVDNYAGGPVSLERLYQIVLDDSNLSGIKLGEKEEFLISVNGAIEPVLGGLHILCEHNVQSSLSVSKDQGRCYVKIHYSINDSNTLEVVEMYVMYLSKRGVTCNLDKANSCILYIFEIQLHELETRFDPFDELEQKVRKDEIKPIMLFVGELNEFNTFAKIETLKSLFENITKKYCSVYFLSIDEYLQKYPGRMVSDVVFLGRYSLIDLEAVKKARLFLVGATITCCARNEQSMKCHEVGADRVILSEDVTTQALNALFQKGGNEDAGSNSDIESLINEAIDRYIDENIKLGPDQSRIMPAHKSKVIESLGLEEKKVEIKIFEKKSGMSIQRYCSNVRLARFIDSIKRNPHTVKVTEEKRIYGFSESSNINPLCKEIYGKTPKEIRDDVRKGVQG